MTAEGLLSCVRSYMFCHVPFQFKTLSTEMAAVGSFACVHSHVVLQIALAWYVFATYVTVKVAFAFVCLEVPCKHSFFGEYVVAYVAAV